MSPFALYLLGVLVIVGGLAFAAVLLNVPPIAVGIAVALVLLAIAAWATRRPRLKPSKFTGETRETPSLDATVLVELRTELMQTPQVSRTAKTSVVQAADPPRTEATTRMPVPNDAQTESITRVDQGSATSKQPRSAPPNDRGTGR